MQIMSHIIKEIKIKELFMEPKKRDQNSPSQWKWKANKVGKN